MINLWGQTGGQVYVPVAADDSMNAPVMLAATGSKGETPFGFAVKWQAPGGITGITWMLNNHQIPEYTGSNDEQINQAIFDSLDGVAPWDLGPILGPVKTCVEY